MTPLANELELVKLDHAAKAVGKTPHNIRDYIQRGRISKYDPQGKAIKRAQNGELRVSLKELRTFLSLVEQGLDKHHEAGLHHELGFHNVPEHQRTKHVHRLHPYLGKFIPQLVEWFLSRYFKQDDITLDPFMGSGTTLIQGNEMQMHTIGIDISPFNCLIARVKADKYDLKNARHTARRLEQFDKVRSSKSISVIQGDSRTQETRSLIAKSLPPSRLIDGIFTSPPYVGQIDYHDQHIYAYELFGFSRKDELEIGPKKRGNLSRPKRSTSKGSPPCSRISFHS